MSAEALTYDEVMYLHGVCNARTGVMLTEILKNEDPEMACLDLQLKAIIDSCLFLAVALEELNSENFKPIMESFAEMPMTGFTWFGRATEGEGREAMGNMVSGVLQPLRAYLAQHTGDLPPEYCAFLDKLINVYGQSE